MHQEKLAMAFYQEAIQRYNDVEAGLMMVAELGTYGSAQNALNLLNQVDKIYQKQNESKLRRSKAEYNMEILRLRKVLDDRVKVEYKK